MQPKPDKRRDDISEKLKELTGDWTEDENEDEDDVTDKPATTELTVPDKSDAVIKKESAEVTDVVKETTVENTDPEPEDDIDLALESLHKGEDETVATTEAAVEAVATSSTAEISQGEVQEEDQIDKSDANVLNEPTVDVGAAIKEENLSIKNENEVEEEFIKEDASQTTALETEVDAVEISNESGRENNAETSGTSIDDVNLESETIRKGLIEELIAEAETPEPNAEASEQPEDAEEMTSTQLPAVDGSEALEDEVTKVETDLEQTVAIKDEEKAVAATTAEVTSDELEKPDTSNVVTIDDKTGTQEKLKSLMSEWVDDDDDNEDENGVSAAAKEQL